MAEKSERERIARVRAASEVVGVGTVGTVVGERWDDAVGMGRRMAELSVRTMFCVRSVAGEARSR